MKRLFVALCLPFISLAIFIGCATTPENYKPQTPDEAAIRDLLIKWESTWNIHDVQGHLAIWDENAKIMYGRDRKIASKVEYVQILPERMKALPIINLESPKIKVTGSKADATVYMKIGNSGQPVAYHLAKKNNIWSIVSWDY